MTGVNDLQQLLAGMEPELHDGEFVFCTVANGNIADLARLDPLGMFREAEGLTLILRREIAEQERLAGAAPMRMITLAVHSSLEAVGLTAAFSARLAREGIAANVVAAFHHDHIFVPAADAAKALAALKALQSESAENVRK
ncbi:ACT domain-containing protein [Mesorhizobium sp. WSM2239]|uniref:ACT domain-containing protein n=2 Tax=unclassified Mesorhizobium TaxID=325217 RepID=A0AAU8D3S2_9HYPH